MKRRFLIATIVCALQACTSQKMMTYNDFQSIQLGENISMVQVAEGRPYQINQLDSGNEEYVYIERIDIGADRELFREYIFVVTKEGKLIEKKIRESASSSMHLNLQ